MKSLLLFLQGRKNIIKRIALLSSIGIVMLVLVAELVAYCISLDGPNAPSSVKASKLNELIRKNRALRRGIAELSPKGVHIILDTPKQILILKDGDRIILQAVVSTGSGNVLKDPSGERQWIFDTPRGEFEVKRKIADPNWIRPDWAFIEEGQDIPGLARQVEEGVLGSMPAFGNGHFIHGPSIRASWVGMLLTGIRVGIRTWKLSTDCLGWEQDIHLLNEIRSLFDRESSSFQCRVSRQRRAMGLCPSTSTFRR
jgi:L,D-transpeptidase YbiS